MSNFVELKISPITHLQQKKLLPIVSLWNHAGQYKPDGETWIFYFKVSAFQEQKITIVLDENNVSYQWKTRAFQLDPKLVWNGMYQPVLVNNYCFIRTPIHPADFNNCKHEITITPTITFGMGDHITTKLMLRAMEEYDFENKVVLDIGTGTGILGIVALKEGARKVIGIDTDPLAVENAAYNAKQNEMILNTQEGPIQNLKVSIGAQYILANIATPVHLSSVEDYDFHLRTGGILMLSGILDTDLDKISKAFEIHGFELLNAEEEAGWMVISFIKKSLFQIY